jgi:hypothetical protein
MVSIVDDDSSVCEGLVDLLSSMGFAAEAFHRADEFLKSDRSDKTSCLIADVHMPGNLRTRPARSSGPVRQDRSYYSDNGFPQGRGPRARPADRRQMLPEQAVQRERIARVHPIRARAARLGVNA